MLPHQHILYISFSMHYKLEKILSQQDNIWSKHLNAVKFHNFIFPQKHLPRCIPRKQISHKAAIPE